MPEQDLKFLLGRYNWVVLGLAAVITVVGSIFNESNFPDVVELSIAPLAIVSAVLAFIVNRTRALESPDSSLREGAAWFLLLISMLTSGLALLYFVIPPEWEAFRETIGSAVIAGIVVVYAGTAKLIWSHLLSLDK